MILARFSSALKPATNEFDWARGPDTPIPFSKSVKNFETHFNSSILFPEAFCNLFIAFIEICIKFFEYQKEYNFYGIRFDLNKCANFTNSSNQNFETN